MNKAQVRRYVRSLEIQHHAERIRRFRLERHPVLRLYRSLRLLMRLEIRGALRELRAVGRALIFRDSEALPKLRHKTLKLRFNPLQDARYRNDPSFFLRNNRGLMRVLVIGDPEIASWADGPLSVTPYNWISPVCLSPRALLLVNLVGDLDGTGWAGLFSLGRMRLSKTFAEIVEASRQFEVEVVVVVEDRSSYPLLEHFSESVTIYDQSQFRLIYGVRLADMTELAS